MSDVAVSSGRKFSEVVKLVTDVGDVKLGGRAARMRELAALRDRLGKWTEQAKRDALGLEQLATKDVAADLKRPVDRRERTALSKLSRMQALNAKRVRATLQSQIAYLESNRSIVSMLGAIGIEVSDAERRRAKEVDRANAALRTALARLIDAIDDGLDILAVIASHFDPENDAAPRSLAEVEAAYPGAAE